MENGINHIRMHYTLSLMDPSSHIALYRKMQSFGATLKFDSHFCISRDNSNFGACTGMLSSENDVFKFL